MFIPKHCNFLCIYVLQNSYHTVSYSMNYSVNCLFIKPSLINVIS